MALSMLISSSVRCTKIHIFIITRRTFRWLWKRWFIILRFRWRNRFIRIRWSIITHRTHLIITIFMTVWMIIYSTCTLHRRMMVWRSLMNRQMCLSQILMGMTCVVLGRTIIPTKKIKSQRFKFCLADVFRLPKSKNRTCIFHNLFSFRCVLVVGVC